MKKMPDFVKWLIVVGVLVAMWFMVVAINDRASRVKMPEPDTSFGFYHVTPEEAGKVESEPAESEPAGEQEAA